MKFARRPNLSHALSMSSIENDTSSALNGTFFIVAIITIAIVLVIVLAVICVGLKRKQRAEAEEEEAGEDEADRREGDGAR